MTKWYRLIFSLLSCLPVLAEPLIDTQFNYYPIYPKQKQDLGKAMNAQTPIIFQGKKFYGNTKWYVNWNFKWQEYPNYCQLTSVSTKLTVTYTLPVIPDNYSTTNETRTVFNRYLAALFKHEQNHKDSGLYAAQEIEKRLLKFPAFSTCKGLETTANQVGNSVIQKYQQRDIEYDQRTEHGRKEGILLDNFMQ